MSFRSLQLMTGAVVAGSLLIQGCCYQTEEVSCGKPAPSCEKSTCVAPSDAPVMLPCPKSEVKPGECYAWVYVPAKTKTTSESVMVRPASERLEVIPAEYAWVEERVLVKEGAAQLEVVQPEFGCGETVVQVDPGHTDWHMEAAGNCKTADNQPADNVFCYVKSDPVRKTIATQVLAKPASVKQTCTPAEYTTVKRQVVKTPAHVERIPIPAEYTCVEKMCVVSPARMEWQQVVCQRDLTPARVEDLKDALTAHGYLTTARDGQLGDQDWNAIRQFQQDNGLASGQLTMDTCTRLGVRY